MQLTTEMMEKTPTNPRTCRIAGPIPAWLPQHLVDRCGGRICARFQFSAGSDLCCTNARRSPRAYGPRSTACCVCRASMGKAARLHALPCPSHGCSALAGVQMITLCKAPQTAGSEAGFNLLGHAAGPRPRTGPDCVSGQRYSKGQFTGPHPAHV